MAKIMCRYCKLNGYYLVTNNSKLPLANYRKIQQTDSALRQQYSSTTYALSPYLPLFYFMKALYTICFYDHLIYFYDFFIHLIKIS